MKGALNRAFFAKIYVDAEKIAGHELNEPFDVLLGAYEQYVIGQAAVLLDELTAETKSAGLLMESGADDRDLPADPTHLTWQVSGWSCASTVDLTGMEPVDRPQAADENRLSWNWGGWAGDVQEGKPRRPDTDR